MPTRQALALLAVLAASPAVAAGPPRLNRLAEIELPSQLSFGPWTIKATPDRLIVLGTHVSSRTLAAYDRGSWKLAWRYPGQVEAFVLCGDLVVLSDLKRRVVAVDLASGKQRWVVEGYYLATHQRRLLHPDRRTDDTRLLLQGNAAALVDVRLGRVVERAPALLAIERYSHGRIGLIGYRYLRPPVGKRALTPPGARLLAVVQLEASDGSVQGIYAWSLQAARRRFTLTRHDERLDPLESVSWELPRLVGSDAFNGAPEPEKLAIDVALQQGRLLLLENYVNYRWSWGRGANRLTAVALPRPRIDLQLWGQREPKAPYQGFTLLPGRVVVTSGPLHPQQPTATVSRLLLERPLSTPAGATVAPVQVRRAGACHLLAPLAGAQNLLCLVLDRRQVAPKIYSNAVEVRLWQGDGLSAPTRLSFGQQYPDDFQVDGGLLLIPLVLRQPGKTGGKLLVLEPQP